MYLLDTDILSNLLKRVPSTALIAKLASVPPEHQFTSSITLGELIYGAHRLGRTIKTSPRTTEAAHFHQISRRFPLTRRLRFAMAR